MNVPGEGAPFRLALFPKRQIAILDMGWLRPGAGNKGTSANDKLFAVRVTKESMRAVGLLWGMPACPYPRCCLAEAKNHGDLDEKGRDFCPPCGIVFEYIMGREPRPAFFNPEKTAE